MTKEIQVTTRAGRVIDRTIRFPNVFAVRRGFESGTYRVTIYRETLTDHEASVLTNALLDLITGQDRA